MMDESDLLELKERISANEKRAASLKGKREYIMKELEEKWQCKSLKEAAKKIRKLKKSADKGMRVIKSMSRKLEEKIHAN